MRKHGEIQFLLNQGVILFEKESEEFVDGNIGICKMVMTTTIIGQVNNYIYILTVDNPDSHVEGGKGRGSV